MVRFACTFELSNMIHKCSSLTPRSLSFGLAALLFKLTIFYVSSSKKFAKKLAFTALNYKGSKSFLILKLSGINVSLKSRLLSFVGFLSIVSKLNFSIAFSIYFRRLKIRHNVYFLVVP